ncbi:unnamed protein product [Gongylonema pulchrum]|uniref:GuKc domain-containing protein n=1 Tax=Gongylonema pulchrum TaxID=637853 RepID=A0A183CV03_9BILA|nr:unnamed protein product [Gongylonema pulchrum]
MSPLVILVTLLLYFYDFLQKYAECAAFHSLLICPCELLLSVLQILLTNSFCFKDYIPVVNLPKCYKGTEDHNESSAPDGSLERLLRESEILRQAFGHLFDYVILNNDIDETIRQLELVVEKLHACPQWLPVSWVY